MGQVIGVWPTLTDRKERKKLPLQKKKGRGVVILAHMLIKQPVISLSPHENFSTVDFKQSIPPLTLKQTKHTCTGNTP